jgi:ketosteroid isomerase-like protein
MRALKILLFLGALIAASPAAAAEPDLAKTKAELRQLHADLNAALARRDRQTLEAIYAPEFVWIHAPGYVDDRATQIDQLLAAAVPPGGLPIPSFDPPRELLVFGDTAILRGPNRTRAGDGTWASTVYVRREGRWRMVQLQGTPMPLERAAIAVPASELARYIGRYGQDNGAAIEVILAEGALVVVGSGFPRRPLTPVAADTFVDKRGDEFVFERDGSGAVSGYRLRLAEGRAVRARRQP